MSTVQCAWCQTTTQNQESNGAEQEEISQGICAACAARVLTEDALQRLGQPLVELLRLQGLLLEMVGDLYEVALTLAPKAGVGIQPAPSVRRWQQERGSTESHA